MAELRNVGIIGTGHYVPQKVVTNFDLMKMVDTSDEWIRTRTGIRERRIADENTATSDLAAQAAERAIQDAGIDADDIDMIIVSTVTPDMNFPSTACIVQEKIGAQRAFAFDIEAACSGFIYGLTIAQQFISTGYCDTALLVCADTLSKITNWEDRNTCVLFGDGAGAVVLGAVSEGYGLLSTVMGADGRGGQSLNMPGGGSRMPLSKEVLDKKLNTIHMNGQDIFKFAVKVMAGASIEVLEKCNLKPEDVDFLIPHQANIRIIDSAVKRLSLSYDKVYVNLDKYGNMSSASIPVALDEALKEGKIHKGDVVLFVGFGAGLTWGSAVVRWAK
ncbi:beta-ketoacyl-ACP synthase III [Caldanaerobius polysaccharolyticus]|uniref:beta-ketoacyl-ACP synthase III n=1 Tax=Caldanaerobius polysaccharolyticus TaxID=44256 RepID=UPI00047AF625|nr:beta-ketoacyl-ACP synthase III [Caldanaerobius polysaccharolyticus]